MSALVPVRSAAYQEAHSARNWPLLTCGLFGPAAGVAVCVILGITVNPQWFPWIIFVLFGLFLVPISLLYRNWPTGIRIDQTAIAIGAVRSPRAMQRRPTVNHQSWGSKNAMTHCNIGVLTSPFMRAALVIDVDPFAVTAAEIRPARYYSNFKDGRFSRLIHPQLSPTWVVPTRHPEALSAALRALPGDRGSVGRQ
jgi:hypothetical protein